MARSNEPFWWAFFSAGGVVAAVLMPVLIFTTGIAAYTGLVAPDRVYDVMRTVPFRILLFVVISLSLFHFAHRFRFTLVDLGLKAMHSLIAVVCYGVAIAGTVAAVVLLVRM